jgi:Calx-beta domain
VTVAYATSNGTASTPGDYQATAGVLTIPAGASSSAITVAVVGDRVREPNETFTVTLSSPSANAIIDDATGIGTIQNDD